MKTIHQRILILLAAATLLGAALVTTTVVCNCSGPSDREQLHPAGWSGRILDKHHEPARQVEEVGHHPVTGEPISFVRKYNERWLLRLQLPTGPAWKEVYREEYEDARVGDWHHGR